MVGWRGKVDTSSYQRGDKFYKAEGTRQVGKVGAEAAVGMARWFEVSMVLWMMGRESGLAG